MREMHADAALARNDNVGQIRNRERAGSACENRARFGKPVENGEKFELHFQFFRNRLDDQFRVADCLFYIGGGRKPGERTAADARIEPSARDAFSEGSPDPGHRFYKPVERYLPARFCIRQQPWHTLFHAPSRPRQSRRWSSPPFFRVLPGQTSGHFSSFLYPSSSKPRTICEPRITTGLRIRLGSLAIS